MSEGGSSRRGLFRELAEAAARAAIPDRKPEPKPAAQRYTLLNDYELKRYSRQLALPEWSELAQLALRDASGLVIGAGALGSPVALYLAGAGVGRLGIVDDDDVELSNLHRQPLHFNPDIGEPKAETAAAKLRFLNPTIVVEAYRARVEESNVVGLIEGQDLVIDCSDSFETRYLVNAACCSTGIDLIEGGAAGWSGLVMAIVPGRTACYRCAFPTEPEDARSCAEAGIVGPAAGVIGSLQALEALKYLTGAVPPMVDAFVSVDLATLQTTRVSVNRRPDCPDCGNL